MLPILESCYKSMSVFKKIISPIYNWLARRYPGFVFIREYSPKEHEKKEIFRKIMNYVSESELKGDYLEFGVFKGGTFATAFKWAQKNKKLQAMKFYAFDSFRGLPAPKGKDIEFKQFTEGEYSASIDIFKDNLRKSGVNLEKVEIIPGWFNRTLNEAIKKRLKIKSAAVIWVDCDLYESTVPVLEFIRDYIVDGSIIVFDDWYHFRGRPDKGEQLAFNEWLKNNPGFTVSEFHKYSWHGNSFIIHKH